MQNVIDGQEVDIHFFDDLFHNGLHLYGSRGFIRFEIGRLVGVREKESHAVISRDFYEGPQIRFDLTRRIHIF